jgi:hypothetical protein
MHERTLEGFFHSLYDVNSRFLSSAVEWKVCITILRESFKLGHLSATLDGWTTFVQTNSKHFHLIHSKFRPNYTEEIPRHSITDVFINFEVRGKIFSLREAFFHLVNELCYFVLFIQARKVFLSYSFAGIPFRAKKGSLSAACY